MEFSLKKYGEQLKDGLIFQNPTFIQVLGMCPTLATTTTVKNGVGMGLSVTAVLMCSNLLVSLLRKFIPKQVRIAVYVVLIAGFVTALEMILKAYIPALNQSLGIFIPLIVVNCIVFARAEVFASRHDAVSSVVDGLAMGLGFTVALFLLSTVREILGNGSFAGIDLFGDMYPKLIMFILPPGAFITLGCFIAGAKKLISFLKKKQGGKV